MPIKIVNLSDLDTSQKEVVLMRPFDQEIYISGPPGSGKTSVAILRTKMLLENGFSGMLFVLYNHSLYGYLSTILRRMNIMSNVSINTKDKYFWDLARQMGVDFPQNGYYDAKYEIILSGLLSMPIIPKYEMVMIDEAQDFNQQELTILRKLSKKVVAVADFDQKIYQTDLKEQVFATLKHAKLSTVYRFGKDIAAVVEQLSKSGEKLTNKVSQMGSTRPYRVKTTNASDIEALCKIIANKQLSDGTMAILSPTRKSLDSLTVMLKAKGVDHFFAPTNNELREYNFDSKKPLLLTSLSSKGLEFDTVVLYDFIGGMWDSQMRRNILYVSLSRACRDLYILEHQFCWPELKQLTGVSEMNDQPQNQENYYDF